MRNYLEFKTIFLSMLAWWQTFTLEGSATHLHHIHFLSKPFCITQTNTNGRSTVGNRRKNGKYQQLPPSQQQQGIYHTKLQTVPQGCPGLIFCAIRRTTTTASTNRKRKGYFLLLLPSAVDVQEQLTPASWNQMEVLVLKEVQVHPSKWAPEDRNQGIQEGGNSPLLAQSTSFLSCSLKWPVCLSCWRKLPCKTPLFCMRKHRRAGTFSAMGTQEQDRHTEQEWLQAQQLVRSECKPQWCITSLW